MIDRVQFENFKSLVDVSIDLAPLTALVGPNGCGKSSVLQGMHLLSQTGLQPRAGKPAGHPSPPGRPFARLSTIWGGPRDPRRLASNRPAQMVLRMRNTKAHELSLAVSVPGDTGEPTFDVQLAPQTSKKLVDEDALRREFRAQGFVSVVYLHLDASEMVRTSVPEDEEPRMAYDGAGLASTLAWMKGADEDAFGDLTSDLRAIVPGVKRIVTQREWVTLSRTERIMIDGQAVWRPTEDRVIGDRFSIQYENGTVVPADLLSEGTVLTLGLLAKLREPRRPKLFLLDDIDRGLHPSAQAQLVDTLRRFLKLDPELQIVCTTHSPYLLDKLAPEEIRILSLDPERRTRVMPLTAHPDYEKWRYGIQTGEMWTTLGESWVVGAPAA